MGVIKELCRMLSDRHVRWWPLGSDIIECVVDDVRYKYHRIGRGLIVSTCTEGTVTPEQAIAATLGADEYAIEHNVDGSYKCPNPKCGCVVDYDIRGDDERIITMDDYVIPFNHCPKCGRRIVEVDE